MKPNFEVELLPEAVEFLEQLDDKTREKIYYNMRKAQLVTDPELFKNSMMKSGSSGHSTVEKRIDFSLFGINLRVSKHWL